MEELLERTKNLIREHCENETTGHDFWHIWRVCQNANKIYEKEKGNPFIIQMICLLCVNLGYASNVVEKKELSQEGKIAQDADRLDAVGAIAIARTFVYTGKQERPMYLPGEEQAVSAEEYQKSGSKTSIGHFYDKVLKVKDKMNTQTAKELAKERHQFVEAYLDEFLAEWNGRK